mmetsp:Transcript_64768/g.148302  ORF Transcript_64768/g.148302 Transcript_64768/m.148302 type:complete len:210 (-) Transcript_64768:116-745(-)
MKRPMSSRVLFSFAASRALEWSAPLLLKHSALLLVASVRNILPTTWAARYSCWITYEHPASYSSVASLLELDTARKGMFLSASSFDSFTSAVWPCTMHDTTSFAPSRLYVAQVLDISGSANTEKIDVPTNGSSSATTEGSPCTEDGAVYGIIGTAYGNGSACPFTDAPDMYMLPAGAGGMLPDACVAMVPEWYMFCGSGAPGLAGGMTK